MPTVLANSYIISILCPVNMPTAIKFLITFKMCAAIFKNLFLNIM